MWNPSGARLSPDPLGLHAEALGELVSSEQAIHHVSLDEANRCRRSSPGRKDGAHVHFDARSPTAAGSAAWDGLDAERLFGVYMVGVSEVAAGARYCVRRGESLLDEESRPGIAAGFVQARWEHRGVASSLRIAIPDSPSRLSLLAERVVADGW